MKKSKTELAREHETHVANEFHFDNARRSRSSGASQQDPIDVTSDNFVIECEYTDKESYGLKESLWKEVRLKAFGGRIPLMAFRFRKEYPVRSIDFVVIELNEFAEIYSGYKKWESLRESLRRSST